MSAIGGEADQKSGQSLEKRAALGAWGSFGASPCCQLHAPFSFVDTRDIEDKLY